MKFLLEIESFMTLSSDPLKYHNFLGV